LPITQKFDSVETDNKTYIRGKVTISTSDIIAKEYESLVIALGPGGKRVEDRLKGSIGGRSDLEDHNTFNFKPVPLSQGSWFLTAILHAKGKPTELLASTISKEVVVKLTSGGPEVPCTDCNKPPSGNGGQPTTPPSTSEPSKVKKFWESITKSAPLTRFGNKIGTTGANAFWIIIGIIVAVGVIIGLARKPNNNHLRKRSY
jgi:hypothetical protein